MTTATPMASSTSYLQRWYLKVKWKAGAKFIASGRKNAKRMLISTKDTDGIPDKN